MIYLLGIWIALVSAVAALFGWAFRRDSKRPYGVRKWTP